MQSRKKNTRRIGGNLEYRIVFHSKSAFNNDAEKALNELAVKVNKLIEKGWKPIGGVCFKYTPATFATQAMIREESEE